jgi:hypothetical protein
VPQRHEGVVVGLCSRTDAVQLGVDLGHRSEQGQRLVDQMAAQVIEQPAGLGRVAELPPAALELRTPALEPRLEAVHPAQPTRADQLGDGAEVAVPAAVLEHAQQQSGLLREPGQVQRLPGGGGQRLVHDHRRARLQRRGGMRHMQSVGGGDHD